MSLMRRTHHAMLALAVISGFSASSMAYADEALWTLIPGTETAPIFIDQSSIQPSQQNLAWRTATLLAQPFDNGTPPRPVPNASATMEITVDCTLRAIRTDAMHQFNQAYAKGEVVKSMTMENNDFQNAQTAQGDVFIVNTVCK